MNSLKYGKTGVTQKIIFDEGVILCISLNLNTKLVCHGLFGCIDLLSEAVHAEPVDLARLALLVG